MLIEEISNGENEKIEFKENAKTTQGSTQDKTNTT